MDFGDGIARHPAPFYEILWCGLAAWVFTRYRQTLAAVPGLAFKLLLCSYLLWRLLSEEWKPVPYAYPLGLSGIQWVCVLALLVYLPVVWRALALLRHEPKRSEQ